MSDYYNVVLSASDTVISVPRTVSGVSGVSGSDGRVCYQLRHRALVTLPDSPQLRWYPIIPLLSC